MLVIETDKLTKRFGKFTAVDGIDLKIKEGDVFGLLGPNGAGKSTTINMICGLITPTSGNIKLLGKSIEDGKKEFGFVPQSIALYDDFTAYENLKFFGNLYGVKGATLKKNIDEALEFTGLADAKYKKARTFSGGMMRRLNIACALVHKPKVIIMDEPTVGIDPQSRNHIMSAIKKLNENNITIVYTSHYMEEIEYLCNQIAIVDHGKVIAEGTKSELKNLVSDKTSLHVRVIGIDKVDEKQLTAIPGVNSVEKYESELHITSDKDVDNLNEILACLMKFDVKVTDIGYSEVSLEKVFLSLTGRALRD